MCSARCRDRGDGVVAALDDGAGDVADAGDVVENPAVGFEEGLADEVMGLDAGEREIIARELGLVPGFDESFRI